MPTAKPRTPARPGVGASAPLADPVGSSRPAGLALAQPAGLAGLALAQPAGLAGLALAQPAGLAELALVRPAREALARWALAPAGACGVFGPAGVGKRTAVRAWLDAVGVGTADRRELDGAAIRIAGVRDAIRFASARPFGVHRALVILRAERLDPAAADALLQLLEEPAPGVIVVLTADSPARLRPTIRSRLRTVHLSPIADLPLPSTLPPLTDATVVRWHRLAAGRPGWLRRQLADPARAALLLAWLDATATLEGADAADALAWASASVAAIREDAAAGGRGRAPAGVADAAGSDVGAGESAEDGDGAADPAAADAEELAEDARSPAALVRAAAAERLALLVRWAHGEWRADVASGGDEARWRVRIAAARGAEGRIAGNVRVEAAWDDLALRWIATGPARA